MMDKKEKAVLDRAWDEGNYSARKGGTADKNPYPARRGSRNRHTYWNQGWLWGRQGFDTSSQRPKLPKLTEEELKHRTVGYTEPDVTVKDKLTKKRVAKFRGVRTATVVFHYKPVKRDFRSMVRDYLKQVFRQMIGDSE